MSKKKLLTKDQAAGKIKDLLTTLAAIHLHNKREKEKQKKENDSQFHAEN